MVYSTDANCHVNRWEGFSISIQMTLVFELRGFFAGYTSRFYTLFIRFFSSEIFHLTCFSLALSSRLSKGWSCFYTRQLTCFRAHRPTQSVFTSVIMLIISKTKFWVFPRRGRGDSAIWNFLSTKLHMIHMNISELRKLLSGHSTLALFQLLVIIIVAQ